MKTKELVLCNLPTCEVQKLAGRNYMIWPLKYRDWFVNNDRVYARFDAYVQNLDTGRGNHKSITVCDQHYRLLQNENEQLALEEILLEEWCEAYHNRRRDNARKALYNQTGSSNSSGIPMDNSGIPEGRETAWG